MYARSPTMRCLACDFSVSVSQPSTIERRGIPFFFLNVVGRNEPKWKVDRI